MSSSNGGRILRTHSHAHDTPVLDLGQEAAERLAEPAVCGPNLSSGELGSFSAAFGYVARLHRSPLIWQVQEVDSLTLDAPGCFEQYRSVTAVSFTKVTSALAAPARARMVEALMDGQARSAIELAVCADVQPSTASSHLGKLLDAGLVRCTKRGRHRYYELRGADVADALETLAELSCSESGHRVGHQDALQVARTCYDHLAGRLGVALTQSLRQRRHIRPAGRDFVLTRIGHSFLCDLGVPVDQVQRKRRIFARQCLDWTEKQPHLGGALGAALAQRCFERGWIRRLPSGRALEVTRRGEAALRLHFGLPSTSQQPAHPSRAFTGRETVRLHWSN